MKRRGIAVTALVGLLCGCTSNPIPEELGWYAVDDGALVRLEPSEHVKRGGTLMHAVYGLGQLSSCSIRDPQASFIIYATDATNVVERIGLSKLQFEDARLIHVAGLPPAFQQKHATALNLFSATNPVPIGVVPLAENSRMFRLVPREPLELGPYALHVGPMEGQDRPGAIYDFLVAPALGSKPSGYWVSMLRDPQQIGLAPLAVTRAGEDGVPVLIQALSEELEAKAEERPSSPISRTLFEVLTDFCAADGAALERLGQELQGVKDDTVRKLILDAVGAAGYKRRVGWTGYAYLSLPALSDPPQTSPNLISAIVANLGHNTPIIRIKAIDALTELGLPREARPAVERLRADQDANVREVAAQAVGAASQ